MSTPEIYRGANVLVRDYMDVKKGDNVLITTDTATDIETAKAILGSAYEAGAKVGVLNIPQLPLQGKLADPYIPTTLTAAAATCDVWIDLTFPYIAGSNTHSEAVESGVRYLLGGDMGAGGLARMFGLVDLDRYFCAYRKFEDILSNGVGKSVRVTDPLGTDVVFTVGKPGFGKPRRASKGGTYLVPGSCTLFPELETVRGDICVNAVFHEYFTQLDSPLRITVDGKIQSVVGGGADHAALDRALRRAGGGDYGYIIHFTYGMNPGARTSSRSFIENSRVMGNNAVGMGLPWWVPGGGENHPDAVLSKQSIWIEGEQVIRDGLPYGSAALTEAASYLVPLLL